jgi:carbon-monoxide dehydrogenase medium subunit
MTRGEINVGHVIDLKALPLKVIAVSSKRIEIGARVTYSDILASALLGQFVPLLPRVVGEITGGRQLVQQATPVGSACFNMPGTDVPGLLVAVDARIIVHGIQGSRTLRARDFFLDAFRVALQPGEFVTGFSLMPHSRAGYCKIKHCSGSWPIATASAVQYSSDGPITLVLGAVQAVPLCFEVTDLTQVDELVREGVRNPWSDVLAPGSYRVRVAAPAARRAIANLEEITS